MPSRRPYERPIADLDAVVGSHAVRIDIDRNHASLGKYPHLPFRPKGDWPDQNPLEGLLAREIFLRERRALIGYLRLFADDSDRTFELSLTQRNSGLRARMLGPHDQNIRPFHICRFALEGALDVGGRTRLSQLARPDAR